MISILHPSRSRPLKAFEAARSFISNMSPCSYQYILSLDSDDPYLKEYRDIFPSKYPYEIVIRKNNNLVEAANAAAKLADQDILILISDDFEAFRDWNNLVGEALRGKSGVLKTYDGIQRYIVTLPIMTANYYRDQGYIYHPSYTHMFCDTDQTHKADLEGKLIIRNDLMFSHNHYSVKGYPKDEVNKRADRSWNTGESTYLERCRSSFGLGTTDIFNLSKEATQTGHIAWLKKKLK